MTKEELLKKKSNIESLAIVSYVSIGIGFLGFMMNPFFGGVLFVTSAILSVIMTNMFKQLSNKFKAIYIKQTIESMLPGAIYSPTLGFSKEEVYNTLVLKKEDRFYSEDMIEGTISNRRFRCADLHLQDVRSNGKSTTVVTVFRGRFYEIEFEKTLDSPVYIVDNQYAFHRFGGFEKMEMEWVAFNQKFDVFGKDQLQAFKVIKPRFMEKVVELKDQYKRIQFGFIENKLFVAIHNGIDTFDLKMFKPINESYIDEVKKEFSDINRLIETLTSEL